MKYRAIRKTLSEIFKRAGVDKPSNPHHFRHSRATFLASKFTESQLCEWFGWVQGSDRPATYVHMSGRDIDADYARLHGIEDEGNPKESKLSPRDCPRCGEERPERLVLPELWTGSVSGSIRGAGEGGGFLRRSDGEGRRDGHRGLPRRSDRTGRGRKSERRDEKGKRENVRGRRISLVFICYPVDQRARGETAGLSGLSAEPTVPVWTALFSNLG